MSLHVYLKVWHEKQGIDSRPLYHYDFWPLNYALHGTYTLISYFYANKLQNWKKNRQKVLLFLMVDTSLSFKHFILIVCACSLQTLWWSSNMCLKINGSMPSASQGPELEEVTASDKERCKHEYTEIWNCLKPSTKGDNLYGVLLIRLTSYVWLTKWLLPYLKFVNEVESKGKNQIYRKLRFANI